jgi:hypothetical protein
MARISGPRRWHEQRWITDSVVHTDGLEWDLWGSITGSGLDGLPGWDHR